MTSTDTKIDTTDTSRTGIFSNIEGVRPESRLTYALRPGLFLVARRAI